MAFKAFRAGKARQQRGGTLVGFIVGVLVGLGIALGVAAYTSKLPIPFLTDTSSRLGTNAGGDRHRNWDPNAPLYGNNAGRVVPTTPSQPQPDTPAANQAASVVTPVVTTPATAPAAPAATTTTTAPAAPPAGAARPAPAASADPLGDLLTARNQTESVQQASIQPQAGGSGYFVQAGAFRLRADAEAQRAKLGMLGHEARITEREQNGRPVYRVRIGPFAGRDMAEGVKQSLDGSGVEAALVRVQ